MWYGCLVLSAIGGLTMNAANAVEPVRKATSVVRTDARSGRLVRTVVVTPKAVVPKAVLAVEPGTPASAPAANDRTEIESIVEEAARVHDVDPALVHSIIKTESNYNPYAVSHKGAEGLMQLVPSTARRLGVKNSFNPKENIEAGVRYYKYLRTMFGDDRLALAAYNAGEGAVAKYNFQVPPYRETVNYVYQVGKRWGETARKRKAEPTKAAAVPEPPKAPEHPRIEHYSDDQGRVYIRTTRQ